MRRSKIITKGQLRLLVSAVIGLILLLAQVAGWLDESRSPAANNQPGLYKVASFDDGDTVTVDMNGVQEKIRFIGVDTPETHDPRKAVQCYGHAAAEFTRNLIGSESLRLEADPLNTNRDRYNRLLRYVYLPNGTLVNAEIIKQGYGFAYLSFPFTKAEEFRLLQQEARESERGLWKDCEPQPNQYGGFTADDAE